MTESVATNNRALGKNRRASKLAKPQEISSQEFLKEFVLEALNNLCDDTGWANLATFGAYLAKLKPDFDSRLYGFKKLSDLVRKKSDIFEIEERIIPESNVKALYLRNKQKQS